jgi:hypothetical protein
VFILVQQQGGNINGSLDTTLHSDDEYYEPINRTPNIIPRTT